MLRVLYVGATSVCLERVNNEAYYAPQSFSVILDGQEQFSCNTNVFSLYGLKRSHVYAVELKGDGVDESLCFRNKAENCALNVRDFGAVGDGEHDDTDAIRTAIGCLPAGGRLYFPAGIYLTRPQMLKSHMTLELAREATLLGWTNREDYPVIPGCISSLDGEDMYFGGFEGNAVPMYQSLLTAQYAEDIAIVGPGTIDGNAQNTDFWTNFRNFKTARPRLVFFNRCKDVTLHGVHACNSPSWQLHPYYSEHVGIYDVFISAPKNSPNTDAIDPESCDGVEIIGCRFSVGDDCIAVKSGKIEMARKYQTPADHHTVRNCLMDFGHGALTLGSELAGGIRNLSVTKCLFHATDRGLRIKSRRGRGKDSIITNVLFDNIRMEGVLTPIVINLWYNCCDPDRYTEYVWSREHLPVDDRTPHMGTFCFRNMVCTDAEAAACYIDGLPESPIEKVILENISVSFAENAEPHVPAMQNFAQERCKLGLYLDNVKEIEVRNVKMHGQVGEMLIADHYDRITTEGFEQV